MQFPNENMLNTMELIQWHAQGKLKPHIHAIYPLEQTQKSDGRNGSAQSTRERLSLNAVNYLFNSAFTIIEMVFPSAFPAISFDAIPMTFPISFIPEAPVFSIID